MNPAPRATPLFDRNSAPLYALLAALFAGALVTANMIASKIVAVGGLYVPAGVLAYSITFPAVDVMSEVWGRRAAQAVVNSGFFVLIASWALVALAIQLPGAPFWQNQEAYAAVLGSAERIIFASLIAYGISQTWDVIQYNWLRERHRGRYLWLRSNASTMVAQTLDSAIFVTIAFYGQAPVLRIIAGQLAVKYVVAVVFDTPLVYAGVWLVRWRIAAAGRAGDGGRARRH